MHPAVISPLKTPATRPFLTAQHVVALVLLAFSLTTSGCMSASGIPKKPWNSDEELKTLTPYLQGDVVAQYNSKASVAEKTAYRDEVIYARLRAIDITYSAFIAAIAKERNMEAVATDSAVLALTGTAALIKPATTKSILSAISGGIVGVKGSIDKNLFYDKTMPVLLTQMEALRKQSLTNILKGLGAPADKYSLTQAMIDLEDYFQAGTIPYALIAMNSAGGAASAKASDDVKGLKVINLTYGAADDPSAVIKIRNWLIDGNPAGTWNVSRQRELQGWLTEKNLKDVMPSTFLNGPYKAERAAFITEKSL